MANKDEPTNPTEDDAALEKRSFDAARFGAITMPPELRRELMFAELPEVPAEQLYGVGPAEMTGVEPKARVNNVADTASVRLSPELMAEAAADQRKRDQVTTVRTAAARRARATVVKGGANWAGRAKVIVAIGIALLVGTVMAMVRGTKERGATQAPATSVATASEPQSLEPQAPESPTSPATSAVGPVLPLTPPSTQSAPEIRSQRPERRDPPRTTSSPVPKPKASSGRTGGAVNGRPSATSAKPPFGVRLAPPED